MPTRPLDLLDLPTVYRYRSAVLSLDSARALTRGNPLSLASLLVRLDPAQRFYTAIHVADKNEHPPLLGGITQAEGETCARLSFLALSETFAEEALLALLDHLTTQAGSWGVYHLLAEVDEQSMLFPMLRKAGFVVYAWQRIWALDGIAPAKSPRYHWRKARPEDLPAIQALYRHIVPGLLQTVDPCPQQAEGMVWSDGEDILVYVGVRRGPRGVLLYPMIHPDAGHIAEGLCDLLHVLSHRHGDGVHLCMRSYQAWLEPILHDLGALAGPRQAIMVRHLVAPLREEAAEKAGPEQAWARPATPIIRSQSVPPPIKIEIPENGSIAYYR